MGKKLLEKSANRLRDNLKKINKELDKFKLSEDIEKAKKLVGKAFIYKDNSYGCGDPGVWDVLYYVYKSKKDRVYFITIQKDIHNKLTIEVGEERFVSYAFNFIQPTTLVKFRKQYKMAMRILQKSYMGI